MEYNYIRKPCLCDHQEPIKQDPIFKENPLLTPYYRKVLKLTPDWFLHLDYEANGDEYDLFVITTRLRYEVPLEYDIDYKSYKDNDKMRYVVDFTDTEFLKNNKSYYQKLINDIVKNNPKHCMFLHMNQLFLTKNKLNPLPNDWVRSIIPYCYKHLLNKYDPILEENQVLININPDKYINDDEVNIEKIQNYYIDFNFVYNQLQEIVLNKLYDYYNYGVVVAHRDFNKDMIEKYNLIPLYNENQDVELYYSNTPISPVFLMDKLRYFRKYK